VQHLEGRPGRNPLAGGPSCLPCCACSAHRHAASQCAGRCPRKVCRFPRAWRAATPASAGGHVWRDACGRHAIRGRARLRCACALRHHARCAQRRQALRAGPWQDARPYSKSTAALLVSRLGTGGPGEKPRRLHAIVCRAGRASKGVANADLLGMLQWPSLPLRAAVTRLAAMHDIR
jgi:hypothetical protein